ncbi:MAG TPA: hypothetical protein VFN45_18415 [Myxococcaceae bacterium]|nr:hypothetical protein [Myxococcaceae bacterium]
MSLAFPLLAAGALILILATTESAPAADRQVQLPDSMPLQTSVPAVVTPAAPSSSHFASPAAAPSPTVTPAAPGQAAPGRNKRSVRAAVLAAKLQHLPKASQNAAPAANPAQEHLPPEEVAAMEAKGMDWRKLEQMMRGGVPGEVPTAAPEQAPQPTEGQEEETR